MGTHISPFVKSPSTQIPFFNSPPTITRHHAAHQPHRPPRSCPCSRSKLGLWCRIWCLFSPLLCIPELDLPLRLTAPSAPPPRAPPQLPTPPPPRLPQPSPFKNLLQRASVPQSPPSQPAFPVSAPLLPTTPLVPHPPSPP